MSDNKTENKNTLISSTKKVEKEKFVKWSDSFKNRNIWNKRIPADTVIRTVTPVLADLLNDGVNIPVLKLESTYITGTKYTNLKSVQIAQGKWLSLSLDNNQYDEHALTYRIANKEIDNNIDDLLTDYITVGHVEKDLTEKYDRIMQMYNAVDGEDFHLPLIQKERILLADSHTEENIAAKITKSKKTYDHYNYNVDIYIRYDILSDKDISVLNPRMLYEKRKKDLKENQQIKKNYQLKQAVRKIENSQISY